MRGTHALKALAACAALAALAMPAQAQRPDVRTFTCDQARALVWQHGAIVLTTGRYTYDRYVSGDRYCVTGYATRPAWVQTSDTQSCPIGYTCEIRSLDDRKWWLRRR